MNMIRGFMDGIAPPLDERRDAQDGQGLAEYALILVLIAIVAIVALVFLGGQVSGMLSKVGSSV